MKKLRTTSRNINLKKDMLKSQEVRSDRQISDVRHGFNKVDGSVGFELSLDAYKDMLQFALAGAFGGVTMQGLPPNFAVTVSAPNATIVRSLGDWVSDGFRVGMYITASTFTNPSNNGVFRVTAVTTLSLTIENASAVVQTSGAFGGVESAGHASGSNGILKLGTTLSTFTMERRFTDVTKYQVFRGCAIGGGELRVQPDSMVGGTLNILGMSSPVSSGTSLGTPTAAPTRSPFSAFDAALYEGGTLRTVVTGATIKFDNKRTLKSVVGSKFSPDVFEGSAEVMVDLAALLEDTTLIDKFTNETESSLYIRLNELGSSYFMVVGFPRLKYVGGDIDPPQEGPIIQQLPFQALVDPTWGTSMWVQSYNV